MSLSDKLPVDKIVTAMMTAVDTVSSIRNWIAERTVSDQSKHRIVSLAVFAGISAPVFSFVFVEFFLSKFATMGTSEGLLFYFVHNMHFTYDVYKLYPFLLLIFTTYFTGGIVYGFTHISPISQWFSEYSIELVPESLIHDVLYLAAALFILSGSLLLSSGGPAFGTTVSAYLAFLAKAQELISTIGVVVGLSSASLRISVHIVDAIAILLTVLISFRLFTAALRVGNVIRLYGISGIVDRLSVSTVNIRLFADILIDSARIYFDFLFYNLIVISIFGILVMIPTVVHIVRHILEIILNL